MKALGGIMPKIWLAVSILVSSFVFGAAETLDWSNSGIQGPKYATILKQLEELEERYPDLTTVIDYGKSNQGRTLRMILIYKKSHLPMGDRPALILSGSTHGNEYLNLEDKLPAEFLRMSRFEGSTIGAFLNQGGAIVSVPILNPDGYENRRRENANGVDLNRDWEVQSAHFTGFKEVETRALSLKLDDLTRPPFNFRFKATVDYHCCIGAILYPWSYTDNPMAEVDKASHIAVSQMADRHLKIEAGTTSQILGYHALGTTKDYYYDHYKALSFTFEGRVGKENLNFEKHVAWWEDMFRYFTQQKTEPILSTFKRKAHPFLRIAD